MSKNDRVMECYKKYLEQGYPSRQAMGMAIEEVQGKKNSDKDDDEDEY